jgi:hypothetical protein
MHLARCLMRRTEPGRAYGQLTAKAVSVLNALLWGFHNSKSGLCFPSYETIAAAAGCARFGVGQSRPRLRYIFLSTSLQQRIRQLATPTSGVV